MLCAQHSGGEGYMDAKYRLLYGRGALLTSPLCQRSSAKGGISSYPGVRVDKAQLDQR